MSTSYTTHSTICEACDVFGADYAEELNAWWSSTEEIGLKYHFRIPYHRTDTLPELPNLTKSADAGCGLCAAIKEGVEAQVESFRGWDETAGGGGGGGGGGRWGPSKRRAGSTAVDEEETGKEEDEEAELIELKLAGGFEFSSDATPTVSNIHPALAIFINTVYTAPGRDVDTSSFIEFEVFGSSTGEWALRFINGNA